MMMILGSVRIVGRLCSAVEVVSTAQITTIGWNDVDLSIPLDL